MTVGELAKLYGMNRQSIYKRINKGDLSKGSDGKVDIAEAIRVFGEPSERNVGVTTLQSTEVLKQTEVDSLKLQVDMLQKQLKKAEQTEDFLKDQIKTKDQSIYLLQTLLSAPKTPPQTDQDTQSDSPRVTTLTTKETSELSEKEQVDVELKPRRKGLFGRVFNAVFEE